MIRYYTLRALCGLMAAGLAAFIALAITAISNDGMG